MTSPDSTASAAPQSHISEQMQAAVGTLLSRKESYPVSESDIRRWAIAAYYPSAPPARFIDAEVAAQTRYKGIVAPEEINPFAWAVASERDPAGDGSAGEDSAGDGAAGNDSVGQGGGDGETGNDPNRLEKSLGLTPPAVKFQVNGGLEIEYGVPIRPGDVITSESRLAGYRERPGRLGLMLFTVTEDTWTNQNHEVVKRSRMTLIRY